MVVAINFVIALASSWNVTRTVGRLSSARRDLGGAVAGGRVFFAGGCSDTASPYQCLEPSAAVDVFSVSGVASSAPPLSIARGWACGCGVSGLAVFAGGGTSGSKPHSPVADVINASDLTLTSFPSALSVGRWGLGCTVVNGSIFFAGGKSIPARGLYAMTDIVDSFQPPCHWTPAPYVLTNKKECVAGATSGENQDVVWAGGWIETPSTGRNGPFFQKPDDTIDIFSTQGESPSPFLQFCFHLLIDNI